MLNRRRLLAVCALLLGVVVGGAFVVWSRPQVVVIPAPIPQAGADPAPLETPLDQRFGLTEESIAKGRAYGDQFAPLELSLGQDTARANARPWHLYVPLDLPGKPAGQHFANTAQEVGDCTAWSFKNAIRQRLAVQIARGKSRDFADPFSPYNYGTARVSIGKGQIGCRSDGSVQSWNAEAYRQFGWISEAEAGIPYSGRLAKEWGCRGVPAQLIELGKQRAGAIAPVRTAAAARDAIVAGYQLPCASMFGTRTIRAIDGRMVARRDDRWAHAMCLDGYDGSGDRRWFHFTNSWGPTAHAAPIDDSPPGGFWISWDDCEWIMSTGDCWALGDVAGFDVQDPIDWSIFDPITSLQSAPRGPPAESQPLIAR